MECHFITPKCTSAYGIWYNGVPVLLRFWLDKNQVLHLTKCLNHALPSPWSKEQWLLTGQTIAMFRNQEANMHSRLRNSCRNSILCWTQEALGFYLNRIGTYGKSNFTSLWREHCWCRRHNITKNNFEFYHSMTLWIRPKSKIFSTWTSNDVNLLG